MSPLPNLELYLIRHGDAADARPGTSDHLRPLTPGGIEDLRGEAAGLHRLKARPEIFLSSPLLRARQTAEVLASCFKSTPAVIVSTALAPAGAWGEVIAELRKHPSSAQIALVGHEPGMGELAARWIGAPSPIPFKKGAVCRIDCARPVRDQARSGEGSGEGSGTLRWFATPKMLLWIGRARDG